MNNSPSVFKQTIKVAALLSVLALAGGCAASPYHYAYTPLMPHGMVNRAVDPSNPYGYPVRSESDSASASRSSRPTTANSYRPSPYNQPKPSGYSYRPSTDTYRPSASAYPTPTYRPTSPTASGGAGGWDYYSSKSWNQPKQIPENIPRNIPCNLGSCY